MHLFRVSKFVSRSICLLFVFFFFLGGGGGLGSCSGLVERISGKLFPRVNDRLRFLDLLIPCKKLLSKHLFLLSI